MSAQPAIFKVHGGLRIWGLQEKIQIINMHYNEKLPIILLIMSPNNISYYNLFHIWRMLWDLEIGFSLFILSV